MRYEVQAVLAATYRGKARRALEQGSDRAALTHVVVLGSEGQAVKVLCRTVKLSSMCEYAEKGPPTCPICAARLARHPGEKINVAYPEVKA